MDSELFPLRIVTGKRFCNREAERKLLKELIDQQCPTVLISPRRYGKSSLAHKVAEELKYPFAMVDFLTAYDAESLCLTIIQTVSTLISRIMPIDLKAVRLLEKCFHGVKIILGSKLIRFEFTSPLEQVDPVRQVLETLKGLENLAAKLKKTVIMFMDEFQQVLKIERGDAIQGAIRSVAQTAKNTAFLFSGSSRHMLTAVFDDPNQPLYMMCEKMFIDRISAQDYVPYIQTAAKITWSKALESAEINRILALSERHPFYVNYLCGRLWRKQTPPTSLAAVDAGWDECLLAEERRLIAELDKLTLNQRALLKAIAKTANLQAPTSAKFLSQIRMSSGTVVPALNALKKRDMIFVDNESVTRVLDPLMKYFLARRV